MRKAHTGQKGAAACAAAALPAILAAVLFGVLLGVTPGPAAFAAPGSGTDVPQADQFSKEELQMQKIRLEVNGRTFALTPADTRAAKALMQMLPLELHLRSYGGFEKVGALGARLPADDTWTEARTGDILLYSGNQIVLMMGTNAWDYTRLARVDDVQGWVQALGEGGVTVRLTLD